MQHGTKGRHYFDTANRPPTVTFDDGRDCRRNFSWVRYAGSHWSYAEPDVIHVEIDEWMVVVTGHNLDHLFRAIQEQSLQSLPVHPEWESEPTRADDTFATGIQFVKLAALAPTGKQRPPLQMRMNLD
jgi:hypothetical protein